MRILIADDESIIRLGLKSMLQELGHEVVAATNGREAVRFAERHRPELAILDIKMPFTDGLEAARIIGRRFPMPILLLTAYSEADLIEQATDLPIHGYLVKPIKAPELTAAMAVASKRFAEARTLTQQNAALAETLATRKLLDQAKGRLMERGMSEADAYRWLQQQARTHHLTMRQVAAAVLQE